MNYKYRVLAVLCSLLITAAAGIQFFTGEIGGAEFWAMLCFSQLILKG